ncbi:hypothetical protein ACFVT1_03835 [Streptomyces sp. NPDC057963]|uniref:hypothetical protein n=1 Tax=Streptomyces sp. NPDC057963 TaxID=3346290 RepID=UPI0036F0F2CF
MKAADAWHLWRNIAGALVKTVGSHHGCIRGSFAESPVMAETIVQAPVATEQPGPVPAPLVPPDGTLDVLGQPRRLVGG